MECPTFRRMLRAATGTIGPHKKPTGRSSAYDFDKHMFGKHGSGRRDLSSNRKAILKEALRAKHRR
jgi:hypothetical protein